MITEIATGEDVKRTSQTPEGHDQARLYEPKVGDRISDNDPRTRRQLTIRRVWWPTSGNRDEAKAIVDDAVGRPFSILLRRIHTDGKKRQSGFNLVIEEKT